MLVDAIVMKIVLKDTRGIQVLANVNVILGVNQVNI